MLAGKVAALQAPGTGDYQARREQVTWNKRLAKARAPEAIIGIDSAMQAAAAIAFAAEHDLKVSPRGSGHHYEAAALRDGGLLLDLAALNRIDVDAESCTAWVGAGVKGGDLVERLAEHGLAFPVGHCADVALSGYLLAGGFGWNAGEWGPACDNVQAVEMVTPAGEILIADEHDHSDLFWAVKGAGAGFFAAVTRYCLRLHPLPPVAFAWSATFAAESAPELADWLTAATAAAHPAAEIIALVGRDPKAGLPAVTVRAIAVGANEHEARANVASFHSPPVEPILDILEESVGFPELRKFSAMPADKRVAADHVWSDSPIGELLGAVYPLAEAPSRMSTVNLVSLGGDGGVPSRPQGGNGALSVGGGVGAGIYAMWSDAADDDANMQWVRQVDDALAPMRTGRYVGEADLTIAPERRSECFSDISLEKLEELLARYDPNGLFFAYP
jgi:FAD/FMN-containing dehydrogenase